jgi:hypothetical protein
MSEHQIKTYTVKENFSLLSMAEGLKKIMEKAECESQVLSLSENNILVQGKNDKFKLGFLNNILGTNKAISVSLTLNSHTLSVNIGKADWGDKALGYALGAFVFAPLIFTASYGLYKQNELKKEIEMFIGLYTSQNSL